MKTLTLRLDDEDHKLFTQLAGADDLPVATFIRRVIRQLAREKGLLATAQPANNTATHTTTAPSTPIHNNVITREDLLKRVESGQQLRDVANSVGIQVSELQARLAQAKAARADGSLQRTLDIQAFMHDNPKPDDGKEYTLMDRPAPSGEGRAFSWEERITTAPAAPQPTYARTLEEENNERGRLLMLAMEGAPVQAAPRKVDPEIAAKLDDLFD